MWLERKKRLPKTQIISVDVENLYVRVEECPLIDRIAGSNGITP